jgi:putative transcriptional regulator
MTAMTLQQNDTETAARAAEERALLVARALLDGKRMAAFESRNASETRARIFAELEGSVHFLAFSLQVSLVRDLGVPFSGEVRELAREMLAGGAVAEEGSTGGEASAPKPGPQRHGETVRALRHRLRLSQAAFAQRYAIPVGTLRDWEQGRSAPDACAALYLSVIARAPELVPRIVAARGAF